MAGRLRYHKKANVTAGLVKSLMRLTRSNLQPLAWSKRIHRASNLHGQLALQHIEELPRMKVKVPLFLGARRHAFLDNAEALTAEEVPAIADTSPRIVLGARSTRFPDR